MWKKTETFIYELSQTVKTHSQEISRVHDGEASVADSLNSLSERLFYYRRGFEQHNINYQELEQKY